MCSHELNGVLVFPVYSQRWEFRAIELEDLDGWLEVFREFGCISEADLVAELRHVGPAAALGAAVAPPDQSVTTV